MSDLIKPGTSRRLGIRQPDRAQPIDFSGLGISMAEIVREWDRISAGLVAAMRPITLGTKR